MSTAGRQQPGEQQRKLGLRTLRGVTGTRPLKPDDDLLAMAQDELARALTLNWAELASVTPWGDSYDGISPSGGDVTVERAYIWSAEPGGDILCEVVVSGGTSRWNQGATVGAIIPKDRGS
jgi:hypothetical protein